MFDLQEPHLHALELLGDLGDVVVVAQCVGNRGEEGLGNHGHGGLGLVEGLDNVDDARMAEADEAGGVCAEEIEEGVLGRLGETGAGAGLGEGALVEDPDAHERVLGGRGGGPGPAGEKPPDQARPAGADRAEEVVVLERPRPGHLLNRGLDLFLDHRRRLRQRLSQGLHVERHGRWHRLVNPEADPGVQRENFREKRTRDLSRVWWGKGRRERTETPTWSVNGVAVCALFFSYSQSYFSKTRSRYAWFCWAMLRG